MAEWEGDDSITFTEVEVPSRSGKSIKLVYKSTEPKHDYSFHGRLHNFFDLNKPDPDKSTREEMVIIDDDQKTAD